LPSWSGRRRWCAPLSLEKTKRRYSGSARINDEARVATVDDVTFQGGSVLGRATVAVGGDLIATAKQTSPDSWTLSARRAIDAPQRVELATGVRTAASANGERDASAAGVGVGVTFDEAVGTSLGDVVVIDLATRAQRTLTGRGNGAFPRVTARVGGRRVVWADARLGSFDIWESVLP